LCLSGHGHSGIGIAFLEKIHNFASASEKGCSTFGVVSCAALHA
jgi:hypothetical protein